MIRVIVSVRDEAEWRRALRTIRAHSVYLLEAREDLAVGDSVQLVLGSPGGDLLGFSSRVIHRSPTGSVSLEIENPEGDPVQLATSAPEAGAPLPIERRDEATCQSSTDGFDDSSAVTTEYDIGVGRLIGEDDHTDPGTVVMEMDDEVEELLHGDSDAATVAAEVLALPDDVPAEVEAAFCDDEATRVEDEATRVEDEATRVEEQVLKGEDDAPPAADLATAAARLQAMSPTERRRYALTADRLERSLLMRDGVKLIQMFVLKNPRLDEQEIHEYARMSTLTAEALSLIAANPRWTGSTRVRLALLKHASTPRQVAKRLLETLSIADLFLLSKTGGVKLEVQQLARAVLERRGFTG
jgi:hypothetical protein